MGRDQDVKYRDAFLAGVLSILFNVFPAGTQAETDAQNGPAYVIAVKKATYDDAGWAGVVSSLQKKHGGMIFTYKDNIEELHGFLLDRMPRYLAIVLKPGEATKAMVARIHRFARSLDDDPYGDVIWGIVTGYTAEDAMAMAAGGKTFQVKHGLFKTEIRWFGDMQEGLMLSETTKNAMYIKPEDKEGYKTAGPDDTTALITETLNSNEVDCVVTAGHGSETDWRLGYSFPDGRIVSEDGRLAAYDTKDKRYDINTFNPKIFYGAGTCLQGNISDPSNCMVLSWIRNGAVQFAGYTGDTWYGYMGSGIGFYFFTLGGTFSFAESFFASNQVMVFDMNNERLSQRDTEGHGYDMDIVAFYGDPALDAKIVPVREPLFRQSLAANKQEDGSYRIAVEFLMSRDGELERPLIAFLPFRIRNVRDVKTDAYKVDISDNFVMMKIVPDGLKRSAKPGEKKHLFFTADPA